MTREGSSTRRTGHRASLAGALALLLCASACATQGDDTGGRPAELPGAGGGARGAQSAAEAGTGGAAGSAVATSGGSPTMADAASGAGGSATDAAPQPPGDLPASCAFTEAELNDPMDLSDELYSVSWRASECVGDAVKSMCGAFSLHGFQYYCLNTTIGDMVRCARGVLLLSPDLCDYTLVGQAPECAGVGASNPANFCATTGCESGCPQPPPWSPPAGIPISPGLFTPCCTLQGECGFTTFGTFSQRICKLGTDTDWPWSTPDTGAE